MCGAVRFFLFDVLIGMFVYVAGRGDGDAAQQWETSLMMMSHIIQVIAMPMLGCLFV